MCAIVMCALIVGAIFAAIGTFIAGEGSGIQTILAIVGLVLGGWWGLGLVARNSQQDRW